MSLLFDTPPEVHALWSTKQSLSNCAALSSSLWKALALNSSQERVCISIQPGVGSVPVTTYQCWAILDTEVEHCDILLPDSWPKQYPAHFSSNRIKLWLVEPALLSTIVISTQSSESYACAAESHSVLERWLHDDNPLLRQGDVFHTQTQDGKTHQYRLEALEPVFQGYSDKSVTKVTLMKSTQTPCELAELTIDEAQDLEAAEIEIDEKFLASSVMTTSLEPTVFGYEPSRSSNDSRTSCPVFRCRPLSRPLPAGDQNTLYLRAASLGKLGILNGDWAIAVSPSSKYRIVRIIALETFEDKEECVWASPLLLHNILLESHAFPPDTKSLTLCPSPFGSAKPAIPVARSVNIARIASPISVNKKFQSYFLHALKEFFETEKRIVKQGDIIAVAIDTDFVRLMDEVEVSEVQPSLSEVGGITLSDYPMNSPQANEIVFFKVTNVECDVISDSSLVDEDLYSGSTLGELGCWVDTSVTRIVQAGVEHARVPNLKSYMQLSRRDAAIFSSLLSRPSSSLLAPNTPYYTILGLASAALIRPASDYDLQLSFLLKGQRGVGKFTVVSWVAQRLGLHLLEVDCYDVLGDNDVKTEGTLRVRFEQASNCSPCVIVLRHLDALSKTTQALDSSKESPVVFALRECIADAQQNWKLTGYPVFVVGTTSEPQRGPGSLLSCFKQEVLFEVPFEEQRLEMLECLLESEILSPDISLQHLATQTAALVAGDLFDLVVRAKSACIKRMSIEYPSKGVSPLAVLLAADFEVALGKARESYSESIGAPKIPNVTWDDVGGLAHVKSDILDTIQLPLEHPELFADGMKRRSGILLYGPPGTGKTLIAKAVATSCSLNFFSVKGPELLNMYIGESEANVRRVFQRARDAKPCVIFFDELDSVAPKRGNQGDSGGVMDRIVSQLLAELDGMSGGKVSSDVFVIGATNRPDLLDPALLRPGRFDRMLYLGVSDTHAAQCNILEALTRKFRLDPDLDLREVAEQCPFNYTGADFYALCSDAMLNAMSRKAEQVDIEIARWNKQQSHNHPHPMTPQYYLAEIATAEDISVLVSKADFYRALAALVPSVSQAEMDHYAQIQRRFSQGVQQ